MSHYDALREAGVAVTLRPTHLWYSDDHACLVTLTAR